MQRSELRIYGGLLLIGMLAVLALLTGVHRDREPQAFGHYALIDLGTNTQNKTKNVPVPGPDMRNRRGQTIEWKELAGGGGVQAILLDHGRSRDLGTLGGKVSYPIAINGAGEVTGYSVRADRSLHAFLWQDGLMQDLGTLGGRCSWAWDLDARGRVVGEADTSGGATHAFLYDRGVLTDLGTLGGAESAARSIDNRGRIVGEAETLNGDLHAFIYRGGVMTDLNRLTTLPRDWVLTSATKIDDTGRIWGEGIYHNVCHTFLLTPAS
ncbi:MAG TPA: hypothetical protein VFA07_14825 [Chthonomonadaceae bacterium]|nr:hypothetical protein [Chthonomonadaceae bacterium]